MPYVGTGRLAAEGQAEQGAKAAAEQLLAMVQSHVMQAGAPQLLRLADLAVSTISDPALREKVAESLISALTLVRFAPVFAHDPQPGRQQAEKILALLAAPPSA
jgi:hypothetical protein